MCLLLIIIFPILLNELTGIDIIIYPQLFILYPVFNPDKVQLYHPFNSDTYIHLKTSSSTPSRSIELHIILYWLHNSCQIQLQMPS